MRLKLFILSILSTVVISLNAQSKLLTIAANINSPADSIEKQLLLSNLDSFLLDTVDHQNNLNVDKNGTTILKSEIAELMKKQENDSSIRPYLLSSTSKDQKKYSIQIAFMGIYMQKPFLVALLNLIAVKNNNKFEFSTQLEANTKSWSNITDDYLEAYYQSESCKEFAINYLKSIKEIDKKLGVSRPTACYFSNSDSTIQQLIEMLGIQYHHDYSRQNWNMISFDTPEMYFNFYPKRGTNNQSADLHDMFHVRAAFAIPEEKRNRQMICGCAYIYYGSWQISWIDIQKIFRERMKYTKETNWMKLYFDRYNFGESQQKHLLITQFINALIIQKVTKDRGFEEVKKLLASGNIYKEREKFFKILNSVAGINENNFNSKASQLIDEAMKNLN